MAQPCPPRHTASPQSDGACGFVNAPNPQALPLRDNWSIWTRFLGKKPEGTVPADPIPVRRLDRNSTLWASWVIASGEARIYYSGDTGYSDSFRKIGERFGGFDIALMENGAYDAYWPSLHLTPEQTVQAFVDLRAKLLYLVHNSTFDLALHPWRHPMDSVLALAQQKSLPLATPEIGEVLTLGQPRENKAWWQALR